MPWGIRPSVLPRPAPTTPPLPLVPTVVLLTLAGGAAAAAAAAQERSNYRRTRALLSRPGSASPPLASGAGAGPPLPPALPAGARLCGAGAGAATAHGWHGRRGAEVADAVAVGHAKLISIGGGRPAASAAVAAPAAPVTLPAEAPAMTWSTGKKRTGGWNSIQWDVVSFSSSVLFSM